MRSCVHFPGGNVIDSSHALSRQRFLWLVAMWQWSRRSLRPSSRGQAVDMRRPVPEWRQRGRLPKRVPAAAFSANIGHHRKVQFLHSPPGLAVSSGRCLPTVPCWLALHGAPAHKQRKPSPSHPPPAGSNTSAPQAARSSAAAGTRHRWRCRPRPGQFRSTQTRATETVDSPQAPTAAEVAREAYSTRVDRIVPAEIRQSDFAEKYQLAGLSAITSEKASEMDLLRAQSSAFLVVPLDLR